MAVDDALAAVGSTRRGLSGAEAAARLVTVGPNALRSHRARLLPVLARQLDSPLLLLLAAAAVASVFVGERTDALVIGAILALSVGLGVVNEYRAARAAEALHDQLRHRCVVWRDGAPVSADVTGLVPGDVVDLQMGEVVPADLRLLATSGLECDESVLSGESVAVAKTSRPLAADGALADLASCALMGTVVSAGSGTGVVVSTGGRTAFGGIAMALAQGQPETEFQVGLRRFSLLLVRVAATLTCGIFVINVVLHRPIVDALLFSLAIAVGISPQLLPAVVATGLAAGSRRLARMKVLVKRLICIEDLGDVEVLFTDKTGTLTEGNVTLARVLPVTPETEDDTTDASGPLLGGLLCNEAVVSDGGAVGGNALDLALWNATEARRLRPDVERHRRLAVLPFDHDRRLTSVLVEDDAGGRTLICKGAPEAVLARCLGVSARARQTLEAEFAAGSRVIAVAVRDAGGLSSIGSDDERGLTLTGFLVFLDPPKPSARTALQRLDGLGVTVKVLTGDNATVARRLCGDLGLGGGVLTGADVDAVDDTRLTELIGRTTVFARVSPEQKARIVHAQRRTGADVAFLGDGVNDAAALHAADVGISVESATDVARDAADVLLLEKDLDVLADGVLEGRRIFANTMKYVLMGTSSNFGNMFSAAGASAFLGFLPMLPGQILLNNLLYDASQLAIPTDRVDPEQLQRPARWDVGLIRRFMLLFGPVSSVFDALTFVVMLRVFHADARLFRTGWFVESLATQTLIVFAIRTRRSPFLRSRPSAPLLVSAVGVAVLGAALPVTPVARDLGFHPLPAGFFLALALLVAGYLALIEVVKGRFYRRAFRPTGGPARHRRRPGRRIHRRAARFSTARPFPSPSLRSASVSGLRSRGPTGRP